MQIERLAAFSDGAQGGNPAGVVIADVLPGADVMGRVAREVGYSETVFAARAGDGWQVRYYSPEAEVAFCGHATVALGAALGARFGAGSYALSLAQGTASVAALADGDGWRATLTSPPTWSRTMPDSLAAVLCEYFALEAGDLDPRMGPQLAHAGVTHGVLALRDRGRLSDMDYEFDDLRAVMEAMGLTTISLIWFASPVLVVARNAFPVGGVVEDPATGAAAAALGGLLVDQGWPLPAGRFTVRQGEDMGMPSVLEVQVTGRPGDPVQVGGRVRVIG
ncbi:MAG: PhzF family phenazine biosynthesis protein [Paracoccaceae bacterium]